MSKVEEDCVICYEKLENVAPLSCGHIIHISCVKKHFKPECPLCRTKLNIEVSGTFPVPNIDFIPETDRKENRNHSDVEGTDDEGEEEEYEYSHSEYEEGDREETWRKKGFNHPEEDEEWDEENPFGDEYNYGLY